MMNAQKKFWKERQDAVANYPHCAGGAQGPIDKILKSEFIFPPD